LNQPFRILFMGTSDFAVPALRKIHEAGHSIPLVVTQPDRPAGRGLELKASPVKTAAQALGLQVFQPEKIGAPEAVEILKRLDADVAVVAAYGQILPSVVLKIAKQACLNIHGSILPKYRGAAPIHYAVMAGEKETGVTVIYMNEKMDEGDILLVEKATIGPEETTGETHDRLAVLGAEGLMKALELLKSGKAPRVPQEGSRASYAPSLKREQCRIHWQKTAREIHDQIRGLSPWPTAETQWKEMNLKIFTSGLIEGANAGGVPGKVLAIGKDGIQVAAAAGVVSLKEVQPPGKKRMPAYDFTLGHPSFKTGEIFS
jgi:methionyl-tRNA formyltransferase